VADVAALMEQGLEGDEDEEELAEALIVSTQGLDEGVAK
jgi:hypothetical protein